MKNKLLVVSVALALFGLSACANPEPAAGKQPVPEIEPSKVEAVEAIAQMLPAELRQRGHLSIGATSTNMPLQYTNEAGELVGAQVDLFKAAAKVLDIDAKIDVVTFDGLQPGIESGRFDVATMGDNKGRQKVLDLTDTFRNGFAVVTKSSFPSDNIDYKKDMCGHSAAVTKSSFSETTLTNLSKECVAAGKPAIEISSYVDNSGVVLAVSSEQNEMALLEVAVSLAYVAKTPDALKIVDRDTEGFYTGVATLKTNTEFRDALRAAMQHLVEIGVYKEIFEGYGIGELMLPELPLNQG